MDISIIFKLAAVGIVITIVCQVLKKSEREDLAGLIIVMTVVIGMVADLFDSIKSIFDLF